MGPTQLSGKLFTPRWGHDNTYTVTFTEEGVLIEMMPRTAEAKYSDTQGLVWDDGKLVSMLTNDGIYPPDGVEGFLGQLWQSWRDNVLSDEDAQRELNAFFDYINASTRAKPETEFWRGVF